MLKQVKVNREPVSSFSVDDSGASAVEYGLIVVAIATVIVVVVFALGQVVNRTFTGACSGLASATSVSDC